MTILTTKKLLENQRSLLLNAGLSFVEYDAIKIEFCPFEVPNHIENAIITSQNSVFSIRNKYPENKGITIQNCFCVGEKTKLLLEDFGHKVVKMTEYASELSDYLVKNHQNDSFHFFCGNIRSEEIPSKLKENNISFEEIVIYKTTLNPKKFEREFDAILFFSPSGVRSYFEANRPNRFPKPVRSHTISVCIGTTTASEAKKYSENVVISNSTTVESVIAKAVKILNA